jgi:hypothetical protein
MKMRDLISICEAKEDLHALMARIRQQNDSAEMMLRDALSNSNRIVFVHPDGRKILVSRSLDPAYQWRVTHFDATGEPSGHIEYGEFARNMSNDIATALKKGFVRS